MIGFSIRRMVVAGFGALLTAAPVLAQNAVVRGTVTSQDRKEPIAGGNVLIAAMDPIRELAGKVAGVRIAQTTGRPGTAPEILIRGPTSINGNGRSQEPLIIVDGVILHVGSIQELGGLDIESVEIVKGAAGAS